MVIPLKISLDLLRDPLFQRELIYSQSHVLNFANVGSWAKPHAMLRVSRESNCWRKTFVKLIILLLSTLLLSNSRQWTRLDLNSTRNQCRFTEGVTVVELLISDHCAFFWVFYCITTSTRNFNKTIGYRKLPSIAHEELKTTFEVLSYLMAHVLILIRCLIHIILFWNQPLMPVLLKRHI